MPPFFVVYGSNSLLAFWWGWNRIGGIKKVRAARSGIGVWS